MANESSATSYVSGRSGDGQVPSSIHKDTPGETAKSGFGTKVKRHCRRWWWLDILIFAVVAVAIFVPVIYVGIQRIAQKGINDSEVETLLQGLRDPRPNSFQLDLDLLLRSDSSFHPTIDGFNGSFFLEDTLPDIKPFAYVQFPTVKSDAEFSVNISQHIEIADMQQFIAYNKLVLTSETFRVAVRGRTKVRIPGLPAYDVDFNKVTTLKGLNKLSGFTLTNPKIHIPPLEDGTTMTSTITIPNPSVLSIEMGNVTMTLLSRNGTYLGYTTIPNLTLHPSTNNNTFNNVKTYAAIEKVQPFLEDGKLDLRIVGNSSVSSDRGEKLLYFEEAIKQPGFEIGFVVDIGEALRNTGSTSTP